MPGTRSDRNNALAERWASALQAGTSVDELEREVLALPLSEASAGLRALGARGGEGAIQLIERFGRSEQEPLVVAAAEALGDVRSVEAAGVVDELSRSTPFRTAQKAARRSLYRLSTQGIHTDHPTVPTPVAVGIKPSEARVYRVIGSAYDGTGTRAVWFAAERPLGGIYEVAVALNDVAGLVDVAGHDTTRKRFAEQETLMRGKDPMAWVELPADYARQLVQEGVDLARSGDGRVPASYLRWAELIGNPPEPLTEALVYGEVNAFEAKMHPTLQSEGPRLFSQPEIEPWFFRPEELGKWVRQLAEPNSSRLLITPETDQGRHERLLREAISELLSPPTLHGLRRRLEETAYIFLRTDREADARRAVAAAVTIEEVRPLRPPHPFLRALMERSLQIAMSTERSGREPLRLARV